MGILGPLQSKMEALQILGEGENSHFSCRAHLVDEQAKNMLKGCLNYIFDSLQAQELGGPEEKNVSMAD